jgi:hypothetical protein
VSSKFFKSFLIEEKSPMTLNPIKLDRFGVTLSLVTLSSLGSMIPGYAASVPGSVGVVLTPSYTSVRTKTDLVQEQGINADRKLGWGGGLLFDAPLADSLSLGVGALYIRRKFQIGTGTTRLERTIPTVFVPVEVKFWLGNVFSIGGGAFGAVKVGDVTDSAVTGTGALVSTTASDHKTIEYGLTASANFLLPIAERTGFLIGARYLYGMTNGSNSSIYDEKIDDLAAQVGLSFSI